MTPLLKEKKMEIKIRNVDPVIVKKIDEMAAKQKISRNEYLRRSISRFALITEVTDLDQRYRELVDTLSDRLQQASDVIKSNTVLIANLLDR